MMRTTVILIILTILGSVLTADIKPAGLFKDHMVIQRDSQASIWGWADVGEPVSVIGSWGDSSETVTDHTGKWLLKLKTPAAGGPYTLTFKGKNTIIRNDIMSGDVWLCSGQSNMEFPLGRIKGNQQDISHANHPNIRLITVQKTSQSRPAMDIRGEWRSCTPQTVIHFSATAYFFARAIHQDQNIPIGLISVSWGGTRIEPWIPSIGFNMVPELKDLAAKVNAVDPTKETGNKNYSDHLTKLKQWISESEVLLKQKEPLTLSPPEPTLGHGNRTPTYLYNGMIAPIIPMTLKGAIWYQGESNGSEGMSYFHKKEALIRSWRSLFDSGDFPFYFVQLANYAKKSSHHGAGGGGWANLRQSQLHSLKIEHTGMAVTIDIGEANDIHPRNKQDVGKRLALWALAKDYGKDIVYSGPLFKRLTIDHHQAIVSFTQTGSGLMVGHKDGKSKTVEVTDEELTWFSIRDHENKWFKAHAKINHDDGTVIVTSPKVEQPTAVRYAFDMNPEGCNLYNKEGLPASPFKTDGYDAEL